MTNRSDNANSTGVAAIETAATSVAIAALPASSAPTATAAPNSTKLNSLACGRARLNRIASAQPLPR